ncbi:hypothetical protein N7450_001083 [Penicillium hetheringtonii]|uniref:Cytochrome c oxidase assembly factor 3 n=1 Tax=Penicillium hetheringtonii TaxID=911720 RepID=A0AAD6H2C6_9EURO|nr:hypothetical protein N7450_001083 [Penicillium hetheringtonii]
MAAGMFLQLNILRQGLPRQTALLRARRPFLVKNAITGFGLFAFTIGVYAYTIRAVGQEEFSDVQIPDTPSKPQSEKK